MITLKAKFIGKSSLGFISNKEYELIMDSQSAEIHIETHVDFIIHMIPGQPDRRTLKCVYSNTPKFLENWEVLSIDGVDNKSKQGVSGFATATGTVTHTTSSAGSVATGTVTQTTSSFIGYAGSTVYSGTAGSVVGYSGTKDFQSIANEIRSDMRNNKLKKILTPLTNGKNSLV